MTRSRILLALLVLLIAIGPAFSQSGTAHGILITITPPSPIGGSGVIQGYYLFRCPNTCSASSSTGWVSVGALIPAASQGGVTTYLDPAAGLSANTTYQYEAVTVDSNGDQSAYMPTPFVIAVTAIPTNPGSPSCSGKVQ